ncbi:MAG: acetylglutamate kinase [Rubricoccaceae bacterium]
MQSPISPPLVAGPFAAGAPEADALTVVKLGGALLADGAALARVWEGVRALGVPVVVVHGGGPQATALARRLGHEPRLVAGRRVTTDLDLQIALWTLRGELNARLVASAQAAGVRAAGLSGADGATVRVARRPPCDVDGETVDFGHVGDVVAADPALARALLTAGFVPVVAPVCADAAGSLYNVNADTVALALAAALGAHALLLVAEAGAVFRRYPDPASRLPTLDARTAKAGVAEGWIADGMRPKLTVAFEALAAGVPHVRICAPDSLALPAAGTRLIAAPPASP